MRISGIYLNEDDPKDKVIIDFIEGSLIKPTQLIKQGLYNLAIGQPIAVVPKVIEPAKQTVSDEVIDDIEDMEGMDFGE